MTTRTTMTIVGVSDNYIMDRMTVSTEHWFKYYCGYCVACSSIIDNDTGKCSPDCTDQEPTIAKLKYTSVEDSTKTPVK